MQKININSKEEYAFTPAELHHLREFVQEVWTTAYYDYDGVMGDLGERAEVMAEILGIRINQRPGAVEYETD